MIVAGELKVDINPYELSSKLFMWY